ncbi:3-carboxy-cis,cis-muconate cycloisomerase [Nocardioides sp. MAH-18]|uniref:3-carboxy-cis,cis-muconate cycloisomerase n=1 Tax=Nocardioides agri TaxID=2682843 RepID=A0A6L6XTK5_9ACTN|nr:MULTISPECIES: lyase family protein [unclassified Nocardioides]MBA2955232.1 3-carboxy-cis,cis-muconate cycloisomerase [Nocardioides sp. CGMCC 1.13656]MVQ50083.1 3-carboxy-cis,cis-muconate cycloisomerase [Nocardioides sp. MAH-18]
MADLFWPGDERAGAHFTAEDFVGAMLTVEEDWLGQGLGLLVDAERLALDAEAGGNPVIPLVRLVREHAPEAHRGLTSQDVVDSALMRMSEAAVGSLLADLRSLIRRLADLAAAHRDTPMVARTLTQHAVPTTFGFRVAAWLTAVLDAEAQVDDLDFPDQLGGAAGTRAAMAELGVEVPAGVPRWHTTRASVTRLGDALVGCTDACARIANDVVTMSRPEIGELSEGTGGGSSTMPGKANPVLSVLVRRAALTTPQLAATLHLAAAQQVDDRADGAWHAEWATLRDLVRRTLTAASQTVDLVSGLVVHADRMAATLAAAGDTVLAEQRSMAAAAGHEPAASYLGDAVAYVDAVVAHARELVEEER